MAKEEAMSYDEVIMGRRSIRGYKPDPVPREVIEDIVSLAVRAPSSYNSQPWHLHIATGEVLDRIRKDSTEPMPLDQAAFTSDVANAPQSNGAMSPPCSSRS